MEHLSGIEPENQALQASVLTILPQMRMEQKKRIELFSPRLKLSILTDRRLLHYWHDSQGSPLIQQACQIGKSSVGVSSSSGLISSTGVKYQWDTSDSVWPSTSHTTSIVPSSSNLPASTHFCVISYSIMENKKIKCNQGKDLYYSTASAGEYWVTLHSMILEVCLFFRNLLHTGFLLEARGM